MRERGDATPEKGRMRERANPTPQRRPPPPTSLPLFPSHSQGLRESGIDKATAKKVLDTWAATGATDPTSLRRLLVGRAAAAGARLALQALLDAGAAAGAFAWGASLDATPPFAGKGIVQVLTFILSGYFATGVASALFLGGAAAFAAAKYGANAGAVLAAVREVAGVEGGAPGGTGVAVLDAAAAAANSVKLITALNDIADLLAKKGNGGAGGGGAGAAGPGEASAPSSAADTLASLSALLTLAQAEERGFDPASLGISREAAADLSASFARYDLNDDGRLQPEELAALCAGEGYALSPDELAAATKLLDADGDGCILFPDFVAWRVKKLAVPGGGGSGNA